MRSYRIVLSALSLVLVISTAAEAKTAATVTCTDGTTSKVGRGACGHHGGVAKGDMTNAPAAAPESGAGNAGTVTCKDGTTGKPGRGACSHHGGAASAGSAASAPASTGSAPKAAAGVAANAADAAGATAKCKDGTYSHSKHHSGTCSHHGGVAQWLDGSAR